MHDTEEEEESGQQFRSHFVTGPFHSRCHLRHLVAPSSHFWCSSNGIACRHSAVMRCISSCAVRLHGSFGPVCLNSFYLVNCLFTLSSLQPWYSMPVCNSLSLRSHQSVVMSVIQVQRAAAGTRLARREGSWLVIIISHLVEDIVDYTASVSLFFSFACDTVVTMVLFFLYDFAFSLTTLIPSWW